MADTQSDPGLPAGVGQFDPVNDPVGQTVLPPPPTPPDSQTLPTNSQNQDEDEDDEDEEDEDDAPTVLRLTEILLSCIFIWILFWCLRVVLPPYTPTYPETLPGGFNRQENIWEKITRPGSHRWSDYLSQEANSALESASYDSVKDRYLRYVTRTKVTSNAEVSEPPVMVHTYVWQEAGPVTETMPTPSSSTPGHSAGETWEAFTPNIRKAMSDARDGLSRAGNIFKHDDQSPLPKDEAKIRKAEAAKALSTYARKVLKELKILETSIAKAVSDPHLHSQLQRPFTITDFNAYAAHVEGKLADLGDRLFHAAEFPLEDETSKRTYSRKNLEFLKLLIAGRLQRLNDMLVVTTLPTADSNTESRPSVSNFMAESTKDGDSQSSKFVAEQASTRSSEELIQPAESEAGTTSSSNTVSTTKNGLSNEDFMSYRHGLAKRIRSLRDALVTSTVPARPAVTPMAVSQPAKPLLVKPSEVSRPVVTPESSITREKGTKKEILSNEDSNSYRSGLTERITSLRGAFFTSAVPARPAVTPLAVLEPAEVPLEIISESKTPVMTSGSSITRKLGTTEQILSEEDSNFYKNGLAERIRSLRNALIDSDVRARPAVTPMTFLQQAELPLEATSEATATIITIESSVTRKKGAYEKWWSTQRLKGPPSAKQASPESISETTANAPIIEQQNSISGKQISPSEPSIPQRMTPAITHGSSTSKTAAGHPKLPLKNQHSTSSTTADKDSDAITTASNGASTRDLERKNAESTPITIRYVEIPAQVSACESSLPQDRICSSDRKTPKAANPFISYPWQKTSWKPKTKPNISTAVIKINSVEKNLYISDDAKASLTLANAHKAKDASVPSYTTTEIDPARVLTDSEYKPQQDFSPVTVDIVEPTHDCSANYEAKCPITVLVNSIHNASKKSGTPTASEVSAIDDSSSGDQSTETRPVKARFHPVLEILNVSSSSPLVAPARRTWKDWFPTIFHSKNQTEGESQKTQVNSASQPSITKSSERASVSDKSPKEKSRSEQFFNSPAYQNKSPRDRAADDILDVSNSLYSVIAQLMAEGNKHFANMTRLQAAWGGLSRAEAVMAQSTILKTMAADKQSRDLLTSYAGVIHKFDRLVGDVSKTTYLLATSSEMTKADLERWREQKSGYYMYLEEIRKRPLFVDQFVTESEGFHWDVLVAAQSKLNLVRASLRKLIASTVT
ncbi:hypothetical protein WAI453_005519 [Rhynchosporium graminicola]